MDANWALAATVVVGVAVVFVVGLAAHAAGLTGLAAALPPLAAGVVVAAGIRLGYG